MLIAALKSQIEVHVAVLAETQASHGNQVSFAVLALAAWVLLRQSPCIGSRSSWSRTRPPRRWGTHARSCGGALGGRRGALQARRLCAHRPGAIGDDDRPLVRGVGAKHSADLANEAVLRSLTASLSPVARQPMTLLAMSIAHTLHLYFNLQSERGGPGPERPIGPGALHTHPHAAVDLHPSVCTMTTRL